jgi:hypothetical protein
MKVELQYQLSPWQAERAAILQRACLSVQAAIQHCQKLKRAVRRVARRFNGRAYKSDPARRLSLAPGTLRMWWDKWRHGGEVPAAFKLNYYRPAPRVPRAVVIRFAGYCATHRHPNVKAAWQAFCKIPLNARQTAVISYGQVCYTFKAALFYEMQAQLKAIATAQAGLNAARLKAVAEITERLPLRVPRRLYVRRGNDFQI